MNDWTWDCVGDAVDVHSNLSDPLKGEFERIADRLVAAAEVRFFPDPDSPRSGISGMDSHGEGRWMIWYINHPRIQQVVITSIQYL